MEKEIENFVAFTRLLKQIILKDIWKFTLMLLPQSDIQVCQD